MRTRFFFFAMLASVAASATVMVTPISTDYTVQMVTFSVSWTNSPTAPYNNRVWIWIDFCPVTGTTPATSFSTATISNPTKTNGNGTITNATARGFFIEYGATNTGTTLTAILSNAPAGKFNWCVYGSDYPPDVTFDKGTYTFKGTTNFIISNPAQTLTTKTIVKANLTVTSSTTFTDATGYPGIGSLYCPYTGNDLYMDATHLCQQRSSGAKNWEAWIKDTRDNELYRVVKMPDDKWWLAQNVKYASVGSAISGCTKDECGRGYTYAQAYASYAGGTSGFGSNVQGICPPGWLLPIQSDWNTMTSSISSSVSVITERLRALNSTCSPKTDYYGWANLVGVIDGETITRNCEGYYKNNGSASHWGLGIDAYCGTYFNTGCNTWMLGCDQWGTAKASIRCFRQL